MILAKEFEGELWIKAADYQRQKKEWVGLTNEEVVMLGYQSNGNECDAIILAEAKLKEKNSG
jgi:hypothetical protein